MRFFVDGKPAKLHVVLDELNQAFASKDVFRIGYGGLTPPFRGAINDVRLFDVRLTDDEVAILSVPETISQIAALPTSERSPAQARKLREGFLAEHSPPAIRKAHRELQRLRFEEQQLVDSFPTTMVMQELPEPRPAHVLLRGATTVRANGSRQRCRKRCRSDCIHRSPPIASIWPAGWLIPRTR